MVTAVLQCVGQCSDSVLDSENAEFAGCAFKITISLVPIRKKTTSGAEKSAPLAPEVEFEPPKSL